MSKKVFITTGAIALIGGLATAFSVASCDQVCSQEAQPSVVVRFYDEAGQPYVNAVAGSVAWWHITDPAIVGSAPDPAVMPPVAEGFQAAECIDATCTAWIAGWETEGTIEVRANVCGHDYIERIDVPMQAGGCHVDTQELTIAVDTSDCEDGIVDSGPPGQPPTHPVDPDGCDSFQQRPSVIVQVATQIDGGYVPLPADAVHGTLHAADGSTQQVVSGMCMDPICSKFAVGTEQTGEFEIQVDACGTSQTERLTVGMQADGCHVDTVQTTIVIDPDRCATHAEPGPVVVATPVPTVCDLMARPSAIVWTLQQLDDMQLSVEVDSLWFTHEDRRHRATCFDAQAGDAGCSIWLAGYEHAGAIELRTEYCGAEQSKEIRVGKTADGCHVETEYVSMLLSTTGCLTGEPEPRQPPAPPTGSER